MHELCQLIRDFPEGSFVLLISLMWAGEESIKAIANRNRPLKVECNCECCTDDEDEE